MLIGLGLQGVLTPRKRDSDAHAAGRLACV